MIKVNNTTNPANHWNNNNSVKLKKTKQCSLRGKLSDFITDIDGWIVSSHSSSDQ